MNPWCKVHEPLPAAHPDECMLAVVHGASSTHPHNRGISALPPRPRLSKVDLLERRLLTMVDRVEGRLAQALAPMALNAGAGTGLHGQPPSLQLTPEQVRPLPDCPLKSLWTQ